MVESLPIVCTLGPAALEARRKGLLAELARRASTSEELADGVRLRFEAREGVLPLLSSAIDAERQCCRFLRFQVTVEPDDGGMSLELTGPAGAREFVLALLEG
jgi:hypothetical protein